MFTYLLATEYIQASRPKGEVLLFRRGHKGLKTQQHDPENLKGDSTAAIADGDIQVTGTIQKQTSIFQWRDITFDIKVKKEEKRLLDHIDGYVRPGTLTCLFGPSGAGKTTLLDVLATRTTIGTVSGSALVDGHSRDISFQRKTGYVMQADIHLETSTVREALRFSALLRQSSHDSSGVTRTKKQKLEYVEEVIKLLNMEDFAEAIIGVPGEGLNIEQRKLLTIATELVARPDLLLFLDEPSSGLDSQTAWSIVSLLEKLTTHGQAILCTIHQPSASLFQRFDRLLFIGPEGKPLYFGELGTDCETVRGYFERNGAGVCGAEMNPAEWLMEIIGAAPGTKAQRDWHSAWLASPERQAVRAELEGMEEVARKIPSTQAERNVSGKDEESQSEKHDGKDGEGRAKRKGDDYAEFAAPFHIQLWECLKRVNVQYWRSPAYIWSKTALCVLTVWLYSSFPVSLFSFLLLV
jgi:ATP-binding cassette subfamily G (WHITE) protein 2 (PDR)